jgi:signal transduction histidine kinase
MKREETKDEDGERGDGGTEEELRESLRKERELNRVRTLFVNMVSHEMRGPLAVIRGIADLMEGGDGKIGKKEREFYSQSIKKSILRMTHTMDDILILGKVQSGQLLFQPRAVDIVKFCGDEASEMEDLNEGRKIIFLPSKAMPGQLCVDGTLVHHILSNLLSNALRYSDGKREVILEIDYESDALIISVKDFGIGIPGEDMGRIFQLFHRGSNTGPRRGMGIGMFVVKHCVALHRGTIEVESKEKVGTTFRVTIPVLR